MCKNEYEIPVNNKAIICWVKWKASLMSLLWFDVNTSWMNCFLNEVFFFFKTKTFHPLKFNILALIFEARKKQSIKLFRLLFIKSWNDVLSPFAKTAKIICCEVFINFENKHSQIRINKRSINDSERIVWMTDKCEIFSFYSEVLNRSS